MEMNGKQIIKQSKKIPKWIKWGYVICILVIIVAVGLTTYREETETPEPIDFTTEGAIGMQANQYAYIDVEGLTTEVAIYGNTENESDSSNDRYYIAISGGYLYLVDLNYETIDQLKPLQEYTYSYDENAVAPEAVRIYGMTEAVPNELKEYAIDYYNQSVSEEYQISMDDFEMYFGSALLNIRKTPVDTTIESVSAVLGVIGIFVIVIIHISIKVVTGRARKYIKKNEYEEELEHQLDNNVEEKHYKDKIILTKDFLVDIRNGGLIAFKYSDIKWVHTHSVKYYGTITISSSIIVHLKDGKTNFQCVEIKGDVTEEFIEIFNKICEKAPVDSLKGYTRENINEYKQYKKDLKRNIL